MDIPPQHYKHSIQLAGTATFKGFSYGEIPVSVEGVFDGTQTHDVETSWSEIQKDQPNLRFWTGTEKSLEIGAADTIATHIRGSLWAMVRRGLACEIDWRRLRKLRIWQRAEAGSWPCRP